jgi:hypothetical protein
MINNICIVISEQDIRESLRVYKLNHAMILSKQGWLKLTTKTGEDSYKISLIWTIDYYICLYKLR